jgi:hypothetical protein
MLTDRQKFVLRSGVGRWGLMWGLAMAVLTTIHYGGLSMDAFFSRLFVVSLGIWLTGGAIAGAVWGMIMWKHRPRER